MYVTFDLLSKLCVIRLLKFLLYLNKIRVGLGLGNADNFVTLSHSINEPYVILCMYKRIRAFTITYIIIARWLGLQIVFLY